MRTTIDVPEDLFRNVKAAAALRGMKLKDYVARLIAIGFDIQSQAEMTPRSPMPDLPFMKGRTAKSHSNREIEQMLMDDDAKLDRPA